MMQRSVSIHAPHAGRDEAAGLSRIVAGVSIHAPHAGRDFSSKTDFHDMEFQSTRPMRGATISIFADVRKDNVSIHAPHAGRDVPNVHRA